MVEAAGERAEAEAFAPEVVDAVLSEGDARAYRRFLEWSVGAGFKLAVLELEAAAAREAIAGWTLGNQPGARGVALDQGATIPVRDLLERAFEGGSVSALVLTGLEALTEHARKLVCAQLNVQRDELTRDFAVPWVMVVDRPVAVDFGIDAPDFADIAALWLNRPAASEAARAERRSRRAGDGSAFMENMAVDDLCRSCFRVVTPAGTGTGFLVARATVATCRHVVEDAGVGGKVLLRLERGGEHEGTVLRIDAADDVALIGLSEGDAARLECEPLSLGDGCEEGDAWVGFGYPGTADGNGLPLHGVVLQARAVSGTRAAVVLHCEEAGGMASSIRGWSGSPIVVGGHVVAMLTGYTPDSEVERGRPAHKQVLALPASTLRRVLGPAARDFWGPLRGYLERVEIENSHIDLRGIRAKHKEATRCAIAELYTPLRVRDGRGRLGCDGTEGVAGGKVTLAEVAWRSPRLLIEGEPGSGKTTFLRLAAWALASDALGRPCPEGGTFAERHLGLDEGPMRLPLFMPLAVLAKRLTGEHDTAERLIEAVSSSPAERRSWLSRLEEGRVVLLLDGLDEVAEPKLRNRLFAWLEAALRKWPKARVLLTSRPYDIERVREIGFSAVTVERFETSEIRAFLDRWSRALPGAEPAYRAELEGAIVGRPEIRRIAQNPVMLTCLCVVHWNEKRIPAGRAAAYRAVVFWLLEQRREQREAQGYPQAFAERALRRLALAMMRDERGKQATYDYHEAVRAVEGEAVDFEDELGRGRALRERLEAWLRWEGTGSGLVVPVGEGALKYWHLTFQEFLAAEELSFWESDEAGDGAWWPVIADKLDVSAWKETVEMFPSCLKPRGDRQVEKLLRRILAQRGAAPGLSADALALGRLHRMLTQLEADDYRAPRDVAATYKELMARAERMFTREGAREVPWKLRIEAAEALGRADFRLQSSALERMLPVPGVPNLWLGKYPVTVLEYEVFVEAGGYEERRYWDEEGWAARQEGGWTEPGSWEEQLQTPNRPIVEVSWYEAMAYAAWLAETTGQRFRLPTEDEWYAAAKSPEGEFPWGDGITPEHANYGGNVERPCAVGVYPEGAAPGGHLDLAGNVWEWCVNSPVDKVTKGSSSSARSALRPLRGGSCWNRPRPLRSAYRYGDDAGNRSGNIGFRLALSPASS